MSMKKLWKQSNTDSVLALLLLAVFAASILSILLTGADSFRALADRDQASFNRRTAAQYITTRLRQADCVGGASLTDFEGTTALTCREEIDGEVYLTRVYFHEGYICELFCSADAALFPGDGEKVMSVAGLTFREEHGLITATITDADGTCAVVSAALRSGREGVR